MDTEDKKVILSRDVTFDETSLMKSAGSQQVENGKTIEISQRVETDAAPRTPDNFVSFEVPAKVTQHVEHVAEEEDTEDVRNQEQDEGQVPDSIAARRPKRNPKKPQWLSKDMVIAYALPVIEDSIPSTHREAVVRAESEL